MILSKRRIELLVDGLENLASEIEEEEHCDFLFEVSDVLKEMARKLDLGVD